MLAGGLPPRAPLACPAALVAVRCGNLQHLARHAAAASILEPCCFPNWAADGAHWDDLDLDEAQGQGLGGGSVRVATVLLYLSGRGVQGWVGGS